MIDIEGLKVETTRFSWRTAMTVYMRAVGLIWIFSGIAEWARIIGMLEVRGVWFWDLGMEMQVAVVYFAVLSLVAGVGLWLTVSWGTVLWILAAASQILCHTVFADVFGSGYLVIGANVLSMLVFIGLVVMVEREDPS